jgi:hypothetical protein
MQLHIKHIQLTPQGTARLCQPVPARDRTIRNPLTDIRRKSRPLQKMSMSVCMWHLLEYYTNYRVTKHLGWIFSTIQIQREFLRILFTKKYLWKSKNGSLALQELQLTLLSLTMKFVISKPVTKEMELQGIQWDKHNFWSLFFISHSKLQPTNFPGA